MPHKRGSRNQIFEGGEARHPLSPLRPAREMMGARFRKDPIKRYESQELSYLAELRADAVDRSDERQLLAGVAMADFECRHGKLPNDSDLCDCWRDPGEKLPVDLAGRIPELIGLSRSAAIRKLLEPQEVPDIEIGKRADTRRAA